MDEIGERHLKAAGHNSAAATAYEIRSVRICDTVPGDPNHFVFRGSFRFTPVDSENFHWISDYAETVFNNDGTLDFAAEFAVERGENGIWRITDMGSWVAADEYGKSGWYRDQGEIDFMSFQTSAAGPEAIAREFWRSIRRDSGRPMSAGTFAVRRRSKSRIFTSVHSMRKP